MNSDYVEDREPLDTKNMLEEGFFKNLGNKDIKVKERSLPDISSAKDFNTEDLLLSLFDVKDKLVSTFERTELNSPVATDLVESINRVGSCIRKLGAESEEFNPLTYISGLKTPNLCKNAERVIENTKQYYSLAKIDNASVSEDGKTIIITFAGEVKDVVYKAMGTITAKVWTGNEALDYVYTPSEGRLSVKTFENGKWIDKSSDKNNAYDIYWELEETNKEAELKTSENDKNKEVLSENAPKEIEEKELKNAETKEEVQQEIQNNLNEDYPIVEVGKNAK